MSDEDKEKLGIEILTELSTEMSDEELDHVKELLVNLFSDESGLTITGSARFTDEAKAEIAANIKQAVIGALAGNTNEYSDVNKALHETLDKVVSEKIKDSNIGYKLTSADITNIRQSVLSSLGNINGKDGKDGINGRDGKDGVNGKDGKDGRDGRTGRDGQTPVKGVDYFTTSELNSITDTITTHMENYVDNQKLAEAVGDKLIKDGTITVVNKNTPVKGKDYFTEEEVAAISATIKNSLVDIVNQSKEELTADMQSGNDDITGMIGTSGNEGEGSNSYSEEKIYKAGDVIVKDGKIYICSEDIAEPETFNEEHWNATDLISISNYYNEYMTESLNQAAADYQSGISQLDSKLTENINVSVTNLKETISVLESKVSDRFTDVVSSINDSLTEVGDRFVAVNQDISELSQSVEEKLSNLAENFSSKLNELSSNTDGKINALSKDTGDKLKALQDSMVKYELKDNGDGTYTLEITDPTAQ